MTSAIEKILDIIIENSPKDGVEVFEAEVETTLTMELS